MAALVRLCKVGVVPAGVTVSGDARQSRLMRVATYGLYANACVACVLYVVRAQDEVETRTRTNAPSA